MELLIKNNIVIIDDEDYTKVNNHSWYLHKSNSNTYLRSRISGKCQYLHRFILNAPKDLQVDHINGNPFDNRKSNLRLCSPKENSRNMTKHKDSKSIYKGVYQVTRAKDVIWKATLYYNNKNLNLGSFATEKEAAVAYNNKALELYGQFAKLNVILE